MNQPFQKPAKSTRRGITIVEVLTSIVVAVIGVAGVLVMIPFAVRQASVGLDLDDATAMAENAVAQFQIEGYGQVGNIGGQEVLPWIDVPQRGSDVPIEPVSVTLFNSHGIYLIDPLWLNAQTDPSVGDYPIPQTIDDMFHYVGSHPLDPQIEMQFRDGIPDTLPRFQPRFVHLLDSSEWFTLVNSIPVPNPMSQAIATRLFVNNNDLQFGLDEDQNGIPIDDRNPPQPYVDFDSNGVALRRQSRGEISWSAVAVARRKTAEIDLLNQIPQNRLGTRVEGFDFYTLVYKDRNFENPSSFTNPDRDPRFLFAVLNDVPQTNPNKVYGTGTIVLAVANPIDIQNDEWMMLVNYDVNGQAQAGFFRVIGSDPGRGRITIEGSDFEIQGSTSNTRSRTYAIYLPNVINVYKRQLTFESEFSLNQQ